MNAIVVTMRGPWQGELEQLRIVSRALSDAGHVVTHVRCEGGYSYCGLHQARDPLVARPPAACERCRAMTLGEKIINLNDSPGEDPDFSSLTLAELKSLESHGINLYENLRPYLLRHFSGDVRRVDSDVGAIRAHVADAVRFGSRFVSLLERVRPDVVVLYNGLFFPDHLFMTLAHARGVRCLVVDRGMRRNSLFVCADEPACNYRNDRLWEGFRKTATEAHLADARAYVASRARAPEDPSGIVRKIVGGDESRFAALTAEPFSAFFAPVAHDTVSMGKDGPLGGLFATIAALSRESARSGRRLIIRAHPDELNALNPSSYPLHQLLIDRGLLHEHIVFLGPEEVWDPYRLARAAEAVFVYNGTLGMELPALGIAVHNFARSHYTEKGFTTEVRSLDQLAAIMAVRAGPVADDARRTALFYLWFYANVSSLDVSALLDEIAPNQWRVPGPSPEATEQRARVAERVTTLLSQPRS